jgi:hypothetical protein
MAPRFRIYAHVLQFCILAGIPTALVGLYAYSNTPNEEELHSKLREKYPDRINASQNNAKEMQIFLDKMKKQPPETNKQFDDLVKEGKTKR